MKKLAFIFIVLFITACQNNEQANDQTKILVQPSTDSSKSIENTFIVDENESNCDCKSANQTFVFKNGNKIALCGEQDEEKLYSEFILLDCINDSIIEDWSEDATVASKINFPNDTLIIEELYGIPNGKNKEVQLLPFFTKKYYYVQNKLMKSSFYKQNLKKYSQKEIEEVLLDFKKTNDNGENMDAYLKSVNQLFWAYYSGSKEAEKELEKLGSKYQTYDGAISEEFDTYIATYEHYKLTK
jgi:hypothetical protein